MFYLSEASHANHDGEITFNLANMSFNAIRKNKNVQYMAEGSDTESTTLVLR